MEYRVLYSMPLNHNDYFCTTLMGEAGCFAAVDTGRLYVSPITVITF